MTSNGPRRPALYSYVLRYVTSLRTSCISLDQLDHGLHNPGASQLPGQSLVQAFTGVARLCPLLPSWVSLTLDGPRPWLTPMTGGKSREGGERRRQESFSWRSRRWGVTFNQWNSYGNKHGSIQMWMLHLSGRLTVLWHDVRHFQIPIT